MWKRRSFCATVLTASLLGLGPGARVASAETIRKSYGVKGFTWAGCASGLESTLKKMNGVDEVKADFGKRRLDIVFDDAVITEKQIVDAAKGIRFTLVKAGSSKDAPKRKWMSNPPTTATRAPHPPNRVERDSGGPGGASRWKPTAWAVGTVA